MLEKATGFVLKQIKYSDNSRIVSIFTKEFGKKDFIVFFGKSKNSKAKLKLLQPLFKLNIVFYTKTKGSLHKIKSLQIAEVFNGIHSDVAKFPAVFLIAEILNKILHTDFQDVRLFDFLDNSLKVLDLTSGINENFNLVFLTKLTKFLGFEPQNNFSMETPYFNLSEGRFVAAFDSINCLDRESSRLFSRLLDYGFEDLDKLYAASQPERSQLLRSVLKFYEIHTEKNLNSNNVLLEFFSYFSH